MLASVVTVGVATIVAWALLGPEGPAIVASFLYLVVRVVLLARPIVRDIRDWLQRRRNRHEYREWRRAERELRRRAGGRAALRYEGIVRAGPRQASGR